MLAFQTRRRKLTVKTMAEPSRWMVVAFAFYNAAARPLRAISSGVAQPSGILTLTVPSIVSGNTLAPIPVVRLPGMTLSHIPRPGFKVLRGCPATCQRGPDRAR